MNGVSLAEKNWTKPLILNSALSVDLYDFYFYMLQAQAVIYKQSFIYDTKQVQLIEYLIS